MFALLILVKTEYMSTIKIMYWTSISNFFSGGQVDIKGKVLFEKLEALFPSPAFNELPAISTKCKGIVKNSQ